VLENSLPDHPQKSRNMSLTQIKSATLSNIFYQPPQTLIFETSPLAILHKRLLNLGVSYKEWTLAFERSKKLGTSIVEELIAHNIIRSESYYQSLAKDLDVLFVSDIVASSLILDENFGQIGYKDPLQVLGTGAPNGSTFVYTAPSFEMEMVLRRLIECDKTQKKRIRICTPLTISQKISQKRSKFCLNWAISGLHDIDSKLSAKQVCTPLQSYMLGIVCTAIPICFYTNFAFFSTVIHVIFSIFFTLLIMIRIGALRQVMRRHITPVTVPNTRFPRYSALIALHKEEDVAYQLVKAMSRLDWPLSRLQVLYVCEGNDYKTIDALNNCTLPVGHSIVKVPRSTPQTKPKALNYALQMCNGEYVVIYDAEDRPHPQQLKEAWAVFSKSDDTLACLQAPLVVTNSQNSWFARMFAFEYSAHFKGLLPYYAKSNIPFPLGGTSNHFKKSALEAVGGWDPFNVTEDADLGIRLYQFGYSSSVLNLPTLEDGPETLKEWLPQRTRWQKGWMQTFIVQNRKITTLLNVMGYKKAYYLEVLLIGFILSPILYSVSIGMALNSILWHAPHNLSFLLFDLSLLLMGYFCFIILGFSCMTHYCIKEKLIILISLPFYWFLLSLAAWRSMYQLIIKPHLWEKTPHRPSFRKRLELMNLD
jgi:cellulose synthase/poly-beta-1,6-N-acetylglucosamine synthase-like glycosyltransferase